ncbi:MAG: hypothetical protein WCX65_13340, partial [bacterium]
MKNKTFCAALFFVLFSAAALSETPPSADNGATQPAAPIRQDYRKKLQDRVFLMMAWEIADEMNLPTEKEDKFLTAMRDHFSQKSELVKEQVEALRLLKKNSGKTAAKNPAEIQAGLNKLDEIRERQQKLDNELNNRLKDILTAEQQAHFAVA